MRVLRVNDSIQPAIAVKRRKGGKEFYEVQCGNFRKGAWGFPVNISNVLVKEEKDKFFTLSNNNYTIVMIDKKKHDPRGNYYHFIGIDFKSETMDELLIFWDLPYLDDIDVKMMGQYHIIGECVSGKKVNNDETKYTPSYVIHVTGSAEFKYSGTRDKEKVSKTIKIKNGEIEIV